MEGTSYTTATTYDNLGRPHTITTPDGGITSNFYNLSGLLFSVSVASVGSISTPLSTDIINEIYYNAKGQRTKIKYENGATTTYQYDPNTYRVSRIHTTRSSDSAQLQDLYYWYDPVGNIAWQTDDAQDVIFYDGSMAGPENKYTYDALYRLIICEGREHAGSTNAINASDGARMGNIPLPADASALRRYTQKYTHDAVGNMLQMQHITTGTGSWTRNMPVSGSRNHINSSTIGSDAPLPETYLHDGWGNIVRGFNHLHTAGGTSNSLFYNWENRLERIQVSGSITTYYQYDADGQRVRKTTINTAAALKQVRKYVGQWEQYQKIDTGTSFIILEQETLHVADGEVRVAIIDTPTIDTLSTGEVQTLRYQLSNHIGSASLELDEVADIISYEEYYPFGNTSYQCGRNAAECSLKRYRYVGKERDDESGFYYIGARYYCPWLARWLAVDPINSDWYNLCKGQPQRNAERQFVEQTASSYEYCYANPVRFTDPSGEQATTTQIQSAQPLRTPPKISIPQELLKNLPNGGELPTPSLGREILKDAAVTTEVEGGSEALLGFLSKAVGLTIGFLLMPANSGPSSDHLPYHPIKLIDNNPKTFVRGDIFQKENQDKQPAFPPPFFEVKELNGDEPIYRSMRTIDGQWIKSPLEGAPNRSQLGARVPADIKPNPLSNLVGGMYTFNQGLSATPYYYNFDPKKETVGVIEAKNLPKGLMAIQDKPDHISIIPAGVMKFTDFQKLLNSIPWTKN